MNFSHHPEHTANIDFKTPLENVVATIKNTSLVNISGSIVLLYFTIHDIDKPCTIEENMNSVKCVCNLLYALLVSNIKNLYSYIKILLGSLILEIIQKTFIDIGRSPSKQDGRMFCSLK